MRPPGDLRDRHVLSEQRRSPQPMRPRRFRPAMSALKIKPSEVVIDAVRRIHVTTPSALPLRGFERTWRSAAQQARSDLP